ncbi:MAG: hypothetical protein R8K20_02050, partial [Gallionellaceae bacterium]
KDDCRPGEVPRLKSKFTQSKVFLIDYDHCEQFPCRRAADVHAYMCKLLPEVFDGAGYLAKKSSSSSVLKDGKSIKGTSWHLYYRANDAFKLKFLADNLMAAAKAQGMTYEKQASDGKMLLRTVVDLMPLKIGACGLVYEAKPIVDGKEYTLADSRIHIVRGGDARTTTLKSIPKAKKVKKEKPCLDVRANGAWHKTRQLHYSGPYRSLTIEQAAVLEDICIECRGINHGTVGYPIEFATTRFRVDHRKVKKCLDALTEAGFIRYISGAAKRKPNKYLLNYDMLFMKKPNGWEWCS